MQEGSEIITIPAQTLGVCNGCDHLRYNHEHHEYGGWQISEYECKKDRKVDLDKRTCGYVVTPENCPFKKQKP